MAKIINWNPQKGFGFIEVRSRKVFVHSTKIYPRPQRGADMSGVELADAHTEIDWGGEKGPAVTFAWTQEFWLEEQAKLVEASRKKKLAEGLETMGPVELIELCENVVGDRASDLFKAYAMQSPEKFKEALAIKEKWNREHDRNYKSVLGYAAPWVARKDLIFVGIRIHLEGDDTVHHAVFEFPEEPGNLQFTSGFEMITAAGERIIKAFDVSGYPDSALLPKGFRVVPDASGGCHTGKELIENSLYEKFFPSEYGRKYSE